MAGTASTTSGSPVWSTEAFKFLLRYTRDTIRRIREFSALRAACETQVSHGDARFVELSQALDGVITSPPYRGLVALGPARRRQLR